MEANAFHLIFHPFIHFLSRLILHLGRGSSDFDLNHFLKLQGKATDFRSNQANNIRRSHHSDADAQSFAAAPVAAVFKHLVTILTGDVRHPASVTTNRLLFFGFPAEFSTLYFAI